MGKKSSAPRLAHVWFAHEADVEESVLKLIKIRFNNLVIKKLTGQKGRPDLAGNLVIYPKWEGDRFMFDTFMSNMKKFKQTKLNLDII
jgi:hypothetical protein